MAQSIIYTSCVGQSSPAAVLNKRTSENSYLSYADGCIWPSNQKLVLGEWIHAHPTENSFMSQIYGVFQSVASISLGRVKSKGENDFGERISDELWESSIEVMQTVYILV